MRFYFIRHAESMNNALWAATGASLGRSEDPLLTETGRAQVLLLADFLRRKNELPPSDPMHNRDLFALTHVYASPMIRAIETGLGVAGAVGKQLVVWPDIHETGGIFLEDEETGVRRGLPGKPRSYFTENYQGLQVGEDMAEAGWWNRPFEENEQIVDRAARVLATLLERHGGTQDNVAIISHGGFYVYLMRAIFCMEREAMWWRMYNTAITRIDFEEENEPVLIYHNRCEHLPADMAW